MGLSEQDQEKEQLRKQLAMGNMLSESAIEPLGKNNLGGGRSNWGGGLAAGAKALQGYMGGRAMQNYRQGSQQGMEDRRGQRSAYMNWLINSQRQQPVGSPNTGQQTGMPGTQGGMTSTSPRLPYNPTEDFQY